MAAKISHMLFTPKYGYLKYTDFICGHASDDTLSMRQ